MENSLEKIKNLVKNSNLTLAEQDDLLSLFAKADEQDLEQILKLFTEDPTWIDKINENFRAKQAALATGDQALWQKIVEAEEAELSKIEGR